MAKAKDSGYSERLARVLSRGRIKIGQRVRIEKAGCVLEGILMPRIEAGDRDCLIIKLDSGYNVGIRFEAGTKISKALTPEVKRIEAESKIELGKIKESFLKFEWDPTKPKVSLIATGGTIASRVDYKTGGVYMLMHPEEFLYNVPELREIVNITEIINPFNKASEDMDSDDWKVIAKATSKSKNPVIITHGTDTLHFTAAALSFMLRSKSEKWDETHTLPLPVVLVGAQRSSDRGSSDAALNLICASRIAVSKISALAQVGICMHASESDEKCYFIRGTRVRKMHTSRRDTFRPIGELPIAEVWPDGKILVHEEKRERKGGAMIADAKFDKKVAILKAYPGSEPRMLRFLVKEGYNGIIIEGTGFGHVPTFAKKSWIDEISRAIKSGIFIGITSQTIYGRTNPYVYRNLRILNECGAVHLEDMLTEVAYVKLGYVLGHTKKFEKVKEVMLKPLAGEITRCSRQFLV